MKDHIFVRLLNIILTCHEMHLGNELQLMTPDASRKSLDPIVKPFVPQSCKIVPQKDKNDKKEINIKTKTEANEWIMVRNTMKYEDAERSNRLARLTQRECVNKYQILEDKDDPSAAESTDAKSVTPQEKEKEETEHACHVDAISETVWMF